MNPRTKGITAAVAGVALGATGLAVLALPAGADDEPELPEITAQELVASTLQAEPPAFAGSVEVSNDLGLGALPGMDMLEFESAQIYHDGKDRARFAVQNGASEYTVVIGEDEAWAYDSAENTARKLDAGTKDAEAAREHARDAAGEHGSEFSDPAAAAQKLVETLSKTSEINVDGTALVADRAAYELVLSPKPSERTVLREVKVAIDASTRLPLRVEVMTNGTPEPILSIGFDEFTVGAQPEGLFEFTPPKGAEVVEVDPAEEARKAEELAKEHGAAIEEFGEGLDVVGEGWDAVVVGTAPEELAGMLSGKGGEEAPEGVDPQQLLEQFGEKVSGDYGTGYLIKTKAGSGLITTDGRFAAGAVPPQVLEEALNK